MVLYWPTSPKGKLCPTCNMRLLKGNGLLISRLSSVLAGSVWTLLDSPCQSFHFLLPVCCWDLGGKQHTQANLCTHRHTRRHTHARTHIWKVKRVKSTTHYRRVMIISACKMMVKVSKRCILQRCITLWNVLFCGLNAILYATFILQLP